MHIQDSSYVTINFTLSLDSGQMVDQSTDEEPLEFVYGKNEIWPAVETRIAGMKEGEKVDFILEPKDGFGEVNPEMIQEIPLDEFPDDLKIEPGMVFSADGDGMPLVFEVKAITDDAIEADFNHPLAGERLHFDIEIIGVRQATEDELTAADHDCDDDECHDCCGHHHE